MTEATYNSGSERDMAALAYNTYKESVGGYAVNGDPLPEFERTTMTVQVGWIAAARAVASAVRNQEIHGG